MSGTIILASSHIGNPEDTPKRSLEALKLGDLLVFEEDRPARKLLKTAGINKSYLKYNEHSRHETINSIIKNLKDGKTVVYMSDQGCPSLADPGQKLSKLAWEIGAAVQVIPGPSSITAAIAACPFNMKEFNFSGFLPKDAHGRAQKLRKLKSLKTPTIILDTPYRLQNLLNSCNEIFTKNTVAFLALEISKNDEQYLLGNFSKLKKDTAEIKKKNFVLIIKQ